VGNNGAPARRKHEKREKHRVKALSPELGERRCEKAVCILVKVSPDKKERLL
jgi:hypothetical protein